MYVPEFGVILTRLNLSHRQVTDNIPVTVPSNFLRFFLQLALLDSVFNEQGYLEKNLDVRDAVDAGIIEDPRLHYVGTGYFEGRTGATPAVNEEWYLRTYPDVAAAVQAGTVASAAEHFSMIGASELRAPAQEYERDAAHWGTVLGGADP